MIFLSAGAFSATTALAHRATFYESPRRAPADELVALEARSGGRLGVKAVATGTGRTIENRSSERFPMCSTHKIITAAAILRRVDAGALTLERRISIERADLLEYAPVVEKKLAAGWMSVGALCEAAVRWSDNAAANLLLRLLGGPAAWTSEIRSIGDRLSRLDRIEPALNEALPVDLRDTTTPAAMTATLSALLFGQALSERSRSQLCGWMYESRITAALFRAGVPDDWRVADKSGSGARGTRNNAGILYPPATAPILLSVYLTGSSGSRAEQDGIVAEVASIVVKELYAA